MTIRSKILFFENNPAYFLSHRLSLARAAQNMGFEVHVAAMPGPERQAIQTAGCVFHAVPLKRSGVNPCAEFFTLMRVIRLYRRLRPDLVYQVTIKPVIYGTLAGRIVGIRRLVSVISGLGYFALDGSLKGSVFRHFIFMLYRFSLRHRCQKIIFHNDDDRDLFVEKGIVRTGDTAIVPGSGVDMSYYFPSDELAGVPVVVLPARMLRDKGVREFVTAATALRTAGVQARFLLAGGTDPGNPSAISEAQLRQWHAEGTIEWLGQVPDMRALYATSHIVCLPSYREGMAKVLIEAAACGKPVVTTDVPGCREVVVTGETGILVPPRDARSLERALRKLIKDGGLRRQMGRNGRRYVVERFAVERIIALTADLFRQLMAMPD